MPPTLHRQPLSSTGSFRISTANRHQGDVVSASPKHSPQHRVTVLFNEHRRRHLGAEDNVADRLGRAAERCLEGLVPEQLAFVLDESRSIGVCNNRQCGKSLCLGRRLVRKCCLRPGAQVVYINATYPEAKRVMWDDTADGLPALLPRLGLVEGRDYTLNKSRMTVKFANGSRIEVLGLDRDEWRKLRGSKLDEAQVDEAQKALGLEESLRSVIGFALTSRKGSFVMAGTPNEFCVGLLHDVTNPEATPVLPGWARHRWTMEDLSPVRPDIWLDALSEKERHGVPDDDPTWMREGLGLWVRGGLGTVFCHERMVHHTGLPTSAIDPRDGSDMPYDFRWRRIIGVDIGFNPDPWAYVVLAYSPFDPNVYEVESWKKVGLSTDQQIEVLQGLVRKHDPQDILVDAGALGKQIANDYRLRGGLPVRAAEKHDKLGSVEVLDSDIRRGTFRAVEGSPLDVEMGQLRWDQREWNHGRKVFDGRFDDHCIDACLYAHRVAFHYLSRAPRVPEHPDDLLRRRLEEEKRKALRPKRRDLGGW